MAKENKYILWAIVLPIIAMIAILADIFKRLNPAIAFVIILLLLLASPILIYFAKKEVSSHELSHNKLKAAPTIVEVRYNKKLRNIALAMRIIGAPLVFVGWRIVKETNKVWYYILAGALLLIGTILVGASIGFMKATNE